MDQTHQILFADKPVGTAEVRREGLYYRMRCRCTLSGEVLSRVLVRCGTREESLGILVPQDGKFCLETRIPVKKIGEGKLSFSVAPRHRAMDGKFIPLCPEEPFRYITGLKEAYLEKRNGRIGIVVKEPGCG